jgi:hypothetical protein
MNRFGSTPWLGSPQLFQGQFLTVNFEYRWLIDIELMPGDPAAFGNPWRGCSTQQGRHRCLNL